MKDSVKRTFLISAAVLSVVGVLFVNASSSIQGYEVGDLASDFSLPATDGKEVSLSDYTSAKGFIVVFTCNTCPYAKAYEKRIIDLDRRYASKGFPVIAINPNDVKASPDDSMEAMKMRYSKAGYTFPYLRDDQQKVTATYGATKTPHVFVLNKESDEDYRVEYIGAIDDSPRNTEDVKVKYVENAVEALLVGNKPTETSKRAIGCSIKWLGS